MEEVTGERLYRDQVCGIDIGKAGMVATGGNAMSYPGPVGPGSDGGIRDEGYGHFP